MEAVVPCRNVCKICINSFNTNMVDLFGDESKEILSILYLCFQISFIYDELKPSKICVQCLNELNIAHGFRSKCLTVDERFKNYCASQEKTNKVQPLLDNSNHAESDDKYDFNESDPDSRSNKNSYSADTDTNSVNVQDIFRCNVCGKILKTMLSLLRHNVSMHEKRKHAGNVSGFGAARRYHCTTCSYSTPHSQTLISHMRRHNGERPYRCKCGKSFTQSSSLAAHHKTHSNVTYFTCTHCGKQFKHAFSLKNHIRVHQSASLDCSICHKLLKSKESLAAHIRRHNNIFNYNCEDCGDTFVTSAELLNHRKKHNSKKNMECYLCGYRTNTKKVLIVHLKRHAGNKTFICEICKMAFYTRGDLMRHQNVHSREKPFSCPACAQRYKYSSSLNKHMKTVHDVSYKWGDFKRKESPKITVNTKDSAQ